MIDYLSLIKNTGAYKTVKSDKQKGRLSHAYLFITPDKESLSFFLKIFARLIMCKEEDPCGRCRTCRLIDSGEFADVFFYPKTTENIMSDDIEDLISNTYVKPFESDKKVFVLNRAESMNASAQNKLLKTLEEPPKNVHILLGATSEYPLLSTVLSRVKKLEIPPFSYETLYNALKDDCTEEERLKDAISCGDGTVGKAKALYSDDNLKTTEDLVFDMLVNMNSSKDILKYSDRLVKEKIDTAQFLSVMSLTLRDMLCGVENKTELAFNKDKAERLKSAKGFNRGAIIYALSAVEEAQKRSKFNTNQTMLTEGLFFKILEGKYKWQKL